MERPARDQVEAAESEHVYSREEDVNGRLSSVCSTLKREHDHGWIPYQVRARELSLPASFIALYSNPSKNGCVKSITAFLFKADNQFTFDKIQYMIHEAQKNLWQLPGRNGVGGNLEFIQMIHTKRNNEFQVKISEDGDPDGMPVVATDEIGFHGENHEQEFWVQSSGKLCFTEEELKYLNDMVKNVSCVSELQRMKTLADLNKATFSAKIVWRKPKMAQVKANLVIEVIAYDHIGESTTTSVTYPMQFNNFGAHSFKSRDKSSEKATEQLSIIFEEARTMLEEVDSIIQFLSDDNQLNPEKVQDLSKTKEKEGELLNYVIRHEHVMPFFLKALTSTGNHQNMKLMDMITNPKE